MKIQNIGILFTVIVMAVVASVMLISWLKFNVNSKSVRRKVRAVIASCIMAIDYALCAPSALRRWYESRSGCLTTQLMANTAYGVGEHEFVMTKFSAVAISTRHLLYIKGATDDLVVVAGAKSQPYCTVGDEVSAAELVLNAKCPVTCNLLGGGKTRRMVASTANCVVGAIVYPAASGKIKAAADIAGSDGVNYPVGIVVSTNGGTPADGDLVEVLTNLPLVGVTF